MDKEHESAKEVEITVYIDPNRLDESVRKDEDYEIKDFRIDKIEIYEDGALYLEAYSERSRVSLFLEISGDDFLRLLGEHKYRLFKAIEDRQRSLSNAKDVLDKL